MRKIVLGMETGIDGGSISLIENEEIIDSASGSGNISKSEDLLSMLADLLKKNFICKSEIGSIIISDGPGSITGIRIGLATAKGLGDALRVPVRSVSILEAMAFRGGGEEPVLTAIITRKGVIYFREYVPGEGQDIGVLSESVGKGQLAEFLDRIKKSYSKSEKLGFIFSEDLSKQLAADREAAELLRTRRVRIVKNDLAESFGRLAWLENSLQINEGF